MHHVWDGLVAVVAFTGGNAMAISTVVRYRNRLQFVLIAFWKISLSTTLSMTALTNAVWLKNQAGRGEEVRPGD